MKYSYNKETQSLVKSTRSIQFEPYLYMNKYMYTSNYSYKYELFAVYNNSGNDRNRWWFIKEPRVRKDIILRSVSGERSINGIVVMIWQWRRCLWTMCSTRTLICSSINVLNKKMIVWMWLCFVGNETRGYFKTESMRFCGSLDRNISTICWKGVESGAWI